MTEYRTYDVQYVERLESEVKLLKWNLRVEEESRDYLHRAGIEKDVIIQSLKRRLEVDDD